MPKLTWNVFSTKYQTPFCFSGSLPKAIPNGQHFDKNRKKLPTAYGLFLEWASITLKGDWSSIKDGRAFMLRVKDVSDASIIKATFKLIGLPKKTNLCANTQVIDFCDSTYSGYISLAKSIGYNL